MNHQAIATRRWVGVINPASSCDVTCWVGGANPAYGTELPASGFASRLRRAHASGDVLVVGHSNTVPGIVAALCACEVGAIDEGTCGDRYDVRIALDGSTTLVRGTY